ncbi:hypothetical protein ZIOFF_046509 [Zingiber officinale]|uniref:PLAC8 family protein n=1 Tax=Zingiber officinale TaxID=94328 RepID=A0A8J5FW53_ZINOF|nr:hypothetical protein ZIOFF_046509 [Zingiber officinale]
MLQPKMVEMESNGDKRDEKEIVEEQGSVISPTVKDQNTLYIQPSQHENVFQDTKKCSFLDIIRNIPHGNKFRKLGPSPSAKFRQFAYERDEFSRSVISEQSPTQQSRVFLVRRIDWASLWSMCKEWFRDPMNIALFIWISIVAISGAILFMVMTGMLNSALPNKSQRDAWFEVNNQILNALFTLMCLYQHPKRFYHLVLLCRWGPNDILVLRKIYCKNGMYKPNEWMHMMVVVSLLHLNCFAQYALCGLNLGYPRSKRPAIGVALCISVSIAAPAFASVYNILSPLGRDYTSETDPEAPAKIVSTAEGLTPRVKSLEKKFSFVVKEDQNLAQSKPEWVGGLFDLWDDISLAYLSIFCSCCIFGWNMERLGFGNMYVHIMTFLLFCLAPFFIFNLAAVNINNEAVREALGVSGILLCFFGLLYGGFWRIQMRKKYNLPSSTFCCGHASSTDCFQWLFCCSCSLAQEVRTADYYEIVEDKLRDKQNDDGQLEDGTPLFRSTPGSPFQGRSSPSIFRMEYRTTPVSYSAGQTPEMHSPVAAQGFPSVTRKEGNMSPAISTAE